MFNFVKHKCIGTTHLLLLFISQLHVYCCSLSLSHVFIVALHLSVTCSTDNTNVYTTYCCKK